MQRRIPETHILCNYYKNSEGRWHAGATDLKNANETAYEICSTLMSKPSPRWTPSTVRIAQ